MHDSEAAPSPDPDDDAGPSIPGSSAEVVHLGREVHHRGSLFDVVSEHIRLPSGVEQRLEIVEHGGAVAIAALDDAGRLVCVEQYRHATGGPLLEVPAGRLEPDEDPADAARRELEEETGLLAGRLELLAEFFPAPGFCTEHMTVFLATELSAAGPQRRPPDEDEELRLERLTPEELLALPCRDAKSIIAAALCRGR